MAADIEAFDIPQALTKMRVNDAHQHLEPCIEDIDYGSGNRGCGLQPLAEFKTIKPGTKLFDSLANFSGSHLRAATVRGAVCRAEHYRHTSGVGHDNSPTPDKNELIELEEPSTASRRHDGRCSR